MQAQVSTAVAPIWLDTVALRTPRSNALTQRGIKYTVVLSIKKEVSFVVTLDSMFKTKDGFKIGTSYKQLRKKYSGAGQFEPGYGYYFQLANGWKAMFTNDKVISDGKMHDSYRITSFFKRDY